MSKLLDKEYVHVFFKYPRSRGKALEIIKNYLPPGSPNETYDLSLTLSEDYKITAMRYGNDYYYLLYFNLLDITSNIDLILVHDNERWMDSFTNEVIHAIGQAIANKYFEFGYDYDVDEKYMYFWDIPSEEAEEKLKKEGEITDEIEVEFEGEKYKIPVNVWLSEGEVDLAESSVYCGYCASILKHLISKKFRLKEAVALD